MTARTETPTSESVHPLVELARTSRVPIAELIGFQMETVGGGHAVASLQVRAAACPTRWEPSTVVCCATCPTRPWAWRL